MHRVFLMFLVNKDTLQVSILRQYSKRIKFQKNKKKYIFLVILKYALLLNHKFTLGKPAGQIEQRSKIENSSLCSLSRNI